MCDIRKVPQLEEGGKKKKKREVILKLQLPAGAGVGYRRGWRPHATEIQHLKLRETKPSSQDMHQYGRRSSTGLALPQGTDIQWVTLECLKLPSKSKSSLKPQ